MEHDPIKRAAGALMAAHRARTSAPVAASMTVSGVVQAGVDAAAKIAQFLKDHPSLGPDLLAVVEALGPLF